MTVRPGPLALALGLSRPCLAAVLGSGGKTSLIHALAAELTKASQKVIVSTTTKIYPPLAGQGDLLLLEDGALLPDRLAPDLLHGRPLTLARRRLPNGKLQGLMPEEFIPLAQDQDLWLLVEADGAARKSLKAWAAWEPVVPPGAGLVLLVLGAGGLGKPLDGRFVHRPELFAAQSGLPQGSPVTPAALARVVLHPEGPLARLPESCEPLLVVTGRQAAGPRSLAELAQRLKPGFSRMLCAGLGYRDLAHLAP